MKYPIISPATILVANKNVIDRDMHQLHEEADKSHNQETNTGSLGNCHELLTVRLGTFLHKVDRILGKLLQRLDENLVKSFLLSHGSDMCCYLLEEGKEMVRIEIWNNNGNTPGN